MLCNFPLMILANFFPRHAHKSTVMQIRWNQNGNWLLTASRDHLLKLFDIRMMKEMQTFRGHKREATGRNNVTFEIIHFMFFKHFSGTLDQSRLIHRGKRLWPWSWVLLFFSIQTSCYLLLFHACPEGIQTPFPTQWFFGNIWNRIKMNID